MRRHSLVTAGLLAALSLPAVARPQAPPSLMSARVQDMTQKTKRAPQGELATVLTTLERELAEAIRLGKTGEARRLLAKGVAILAGDVWTPRLEFARSLVLRTDHTIADSSKLLVVRLEQIYAPAIDLPNTVSARLLLTQRPVRAPGAAPLPPGTTPPDDTVVKSFEAVSPIARDLRDTPLSFEIDVRGVPDGAYRLRAEVSNGTEILATAALGLSAIGGLDERLARLSAGAVAVPERVRAEDMSPVDYVRNVNLSRIGMGGLDVKADIASAESVLRAAKAGKDPFAGRTGDITRHYLFAPANEVLPYRLYVPTGYDRSKPLPLVVALHGLGGSEASFFEAYERRLPAVAEKHGYLVVAPLGYRSDGFYGWGVGDAPADPAARRLQERSEQDVMEVLARVKRDYRVDESRVYLMGHSMGAIGTWRLAAKYPEVWAAVGPISGSGTPSTVERMKGIPQIVVHGDNDPTVPVDASRLMVAEMKRLGVEVQYIEVPGGDHGSVVAPNIEAIVAFFDSHQRQR